MSEIFHDNTFRGDPLNKNTMSEIFHVFYVDPSSPYKQYHLGGIPSTKTLFVFATIWLTYAEAMMKTSAMMIQLM